MSTETITETIEHLDFTPDEPCQAILGPCAGPVHPAKYLARLDCCGSRLVALCPYPLKQWVTIRCVVCNSRVPDGRVTVVRTLR